jgi:CubicO group peptidase (beta-lactamase class C family)
MSTFPRIRRRVEEGIQSGEHFGVQLAVARDGELLLDEAMGSNAAFEPLEPDMLMLWLSACKPVAAVAIGWLLDRGKMDLHQPVATWIPDFAARNKDRITPWHLLTHTAGIRGATLGWTPLSWDEAIGRICYTKPEPHWEPGEKAGYHVDSAWYMLGELVRVLDGRPYEQFVREEIFLPMEMPNCWVGIPEDVYVEIEDRVAAIYDTHSGMPVLQEDLSRRESVTCCRPGGNGRGPAREFLRFYECMRRMTAGVEGVLRVETARDLVGPHRIGMYDKTFRHTIDWGLGFMRQSDYTAPGEVPYQFGTYASRQAFGHCGNQSTAAFCDPVHGLSVVVLTNGMPGEERHQRRMRDLLDALYTDLGILDT